MKAFVYLVFPNSMLSVLQGSSHTDDEPMEHGIITSVTHGAMSGTCHYILNLSLSLGVCVRVCAHLRWHLRARAHDYLFVPQ